MPNLFTPFEIKHLRLTNRIVMPPIAGEKAGEDGRISDENLSDYTRRASSGMGLLIVEHNFVHPEGRVSLRQMSIARDSDVPLHRNLTQSIHDNSLPAALQINHSGSNRQKPFSECRGASATPHPTSGLTPRELSPSEIAELVDQFAQAAVRAGNSGYDLVEIHCAHGYLLSQFLSPLTNHRKDRYGGALKNRRRFLLEVIEEVKSRIPDRICLMVRLGVADNPPDMLPFPGGLPIEEGIEVCRVLQEEKIDILDISAGICGSRPAGVEGEGYFLPFAQALREKIQLPLLITGGITQPETAERIIQNRWADLVGVGRSLMAEPDWVRRAYRSVQE